MIRLHQHMNLNMPIFLNYEETFAKYIGLPIFKICYVYFIPCVQTNGLGIVYLGELHTKYTPRDEVDRGNKFPRVNSRWKVDK